MKKKKGGCWTGVTKWSNINLQDQILWSFPQLLGAKIYFDIADYAFVKRLQWQGENGESAVRPCFVALTWRPDSLSSRRIISDSYGSARAFRHFTIILF